MSAPQTALDAVGAAIIGPYLEAQKQREAGE